MNKNGSNFIPLVLDTRLLVAVNKKSSEKKQLNATYLLSLIVEHCKDDLSIEAYDELKLKYSISAEEQMELKRLKEIERKELEKKKLEIKERELAFKEKNAVAYKKQTEIYEEKRERKRLEEQRKGLLSQMRTARYEGKTQLWEKLRTELHEVVKKIDYEKSSD